MSYKNNISNGFKHHVCYFGTPILGQEEPVLYSIYRKYCLKENKIALIAISDLINNFNYFYEYIDREIKDLKE